MPATPEPTLKSLLELNDDVIELLKNFLPKSQDLSAISKTCKRTYGFFKQNVLDLGAAELLAFIVRGEAEKAMRMITKSPHLLFIKAEAQDFALGYDGRRRTIKGSPFQAILGAADVPLLKWLDQPFFDGYRQEMQAQFLEQFPDAQNAIYSDYDEQIVMDILVGLVDAISQDPCVNCKPNPNTENALQAFRAYFAPRTVTTGLHFDLRILIKAFELYDANYHRWRRANHNYNQAIVFWGLVIGYIQRMLVAVDAQALCAGIFYVVESGDLRLPKRKLKLSSGVDYYPRDVNSEEALGVTFGVYSYYTASAFCPVDKVGRPQLPHQLIALSEKKLEVLQNFHAHLTRVKRQRRV